MLAILALLLGAVVAAAALSRAPAPNAPPDPYRWARPAAARLAAAGLWPELAGADLARVATRADLDRATDDPHRPAGGEPRSGRAGLGLARRPADRSTPSGWSPSAWGSRR